MILLFSSDWFVFEYEHRSLRDPIPATGVWWTQGLLEGLQSGDFRFQGLDVEVGVILGWVSPDELQGLQDMGRRWAFTGQMGTLWLESVDIGDVGQLDRSSVPVGPRGTTLSRLASDAFLLGTDSVAGFVVPGVGTVRVDNVVRREDLSFGVRVLGEGNGGQGGDDDLWKGEKEETPGEYC